MLKKANQDLRKNVRNAIAEAIQLQSNMKKIEKANLMHYAPNFFPYQNGENTDKIRLEENLKSLRRYLETVKPEIVEANLIKLQAVLKSIQVPPTVDISSLNQGLSFKENMQPTEDAIKKSIAILEKFNREIYLELDEKYINNLCKVNTNMVEEYSKFDGFQTEITLDRCSSFKQLEGIKKLTREEAAEELEKVRAACRGPVSRS